MDEKACAEPCTPCVSARHVILMGLRGSGKSTLGARVAMDLGLPFQDLDDLSARILGCERVRDAFARHGEPIFRHAERAALRQALAEPAHVIALGGGTPTAPGAADLLRAAAGRGSLLVYLRASAPCLRARMEVEDNADRPSLTGIGVLDEIPEILARRDPLYRDLAGEILEIDGMDLDACARRIVDMARSRAHWPSAGG